MPICFLGVCGCVCECVMCVDFCVRVWRVGVIFFFGCISRFLVVQQLSGILAFSCTSSISVAVIQFLNLCVLLMEINFELN